MVIGMPGQRKRKRQQQARHQQAVALPEGHWQGIFETQDYEEWRGWLREHLAEYAVTDRAHLRMDTLCGRLVQPTTYRMSLFVPRHASGGVA
ncbi:hypothetical protein ABIA33_005673 [Streptacidiphilus sp. MAP12-16]|uniref:hypothetical protein n=1 Tax=Streptacidiphilus sp. MAP12-16 TaxID=3156300 RepID=UPI0035139C2F